MQCVRSPWRFIAINEGILGAVNACMRMGNVDDISGETCCSAYYIPTMAAWSELLRRLLLCDRIHGSSSMDLVDGQGWLHRRAPQIQQIKSLFFRACQQIESKVNIQVVDILLNLQCMPSFSNLTFSYIHFNSIN